MTVSPAQGTAPVARMGGSHERSPTLMDGLLLYIDPGSGSLIIQAVIATLVAVPFFLRHHISRAVGALRRRPSSADSGNARQDES